MKDIDEMDMLGYLSLRAWASRKEDEAAHAKPPKRYIDEIWPKGLD